MMPSLANASSFCIRKSVRTSQTFADNLQIADRSSTLRHSRAGFSTERPSETPRSSIGVLSQQGTGLRFTAPIHLKLL
jgi:hypothetical protein